MKEFSSTLAETLRYEEAAFANTNLCSIWNLVWGLFSTETVALFVWIVAKPRYQDRR